MQISKIKSILDAHSVPNYIEGGRIYADTMEAYAEEFSAVEDLTDYTRAALFAWLGY